MAQAGYSQSYTLSSSGASVKVLQAVDGGQLTVPGNAWLLKADFAPQGSDLLLTGPDGAQVLVRDFYNLETPPDLLTDSGAMISADLAIRLAGPAAPGQVAALGVELAQAGESIGRVEATDGLVEAIRVDGTKVALSKGDDIFQGDTLVTGKGAAVGITFIDDTTFSLGEEGRMVIDEMVYDPGTQEGGFNASLVQGVFSFVSGQIAKTGPDAMTVSTPVATIGIRGTKVAGRAAQEGSDNTISLLPETDAQGNQIVGELAVTNQGGTVTLNAVGATVQMSSAFAPPPAPVVFSQQQLQQNYGAALTTLSTTAAAKASADAAEDAAQAEQAEAEAQAAEAEAEEAAAEAEAAAAEAEAAAAEAEASGDPEAIAAAEAAAAEAEAKAAEAEAKAAEAEAAAAEAEAATQEAEQSAQRSEQANTEMQAQAEAFAAFGGPVPGDGPSGAGATGEEPGPTDGDAPPDGGNPEGGDAPPEGGPLADDGSNLPGDGSLPEEGPLPEGDGNLFTGGGADPFLGGSDPFFGGGDPLIGGSGDDPLFGSGDPLLGGGGDDPLFGGGDPLFGSGGDPLFGDGDGPIFNDPDDPPPPPGGGKEGDGGGGGGSSSSNATPKVTMQNVAVHSGSNLGFTNAANFDSLVTNSFQAGASGLADVDNDGDLDVVINGYDSVAGSSSADTYVGLNDGSGNFTYSATNMNKSMGRFELTDVNDDGKIDIVGVENSTTSQPVYFGDGAGGFTSSGQTISTTGGIVGALNVGVADLNGDGLKDMFVNVDSGNKVYLNAQNGDAAGTFTDTGQSLATTKGTPSYRAVALGDIDGDGDIDAVTSSWAEAGDVWKNDGSGTFTSHQVLSTISSSAGNGIDLGDLDGDGDLDLFVFNRGTTVANRAMLNDGTGTFTDTGQNLGATSGGDTVRQGGQLADIDGDGDLDAISATDGKMEIFINDGSANFTQSSLNVGTGWSTQVHAGDLNGDSTKDVLVANYATGSHILTNDLPVVNAKVVHDNTFTFERVTFGVNDADNPSASSLTFTVSAIPANGSIKLSGSPLSVNGTFTQADVNAGNVTYIHDGTATTTDSFQFTVSDGVTTTVTQTFNMQVTSDEFTGGFGKDSVTLSAAQSSARVDLAEGTDSLTLANGTNNVIVANTETVVGGSGTDSVVIGNSGPITSLQFDGTDDYVLLPGTAYDNIAAGTVEAWVKVSDFNSANIIIAKQKDGVDTMGVFGIGGTGGSGFTSTTQGALTWHGWNTGGTAVSSGTITAGEWHHVAVTFSTSQARFYIDGVLDSTIGGNFHVPSNTSADSTIGDLITGGTTNFEPFGGEISSVRVWTAERTLSEIQSDLSGSPIGDTTKLAAEWLLADGSGTSIADTSSNSNTGTLYNQTGGSETWITNSSSTNTSTTLSGVETIVGSNGADTITVSGSTAATITGGEGADTITGGTGTDSITGGKGADTLTGGSGIDTFTVITADVAAAGTTSAAYDTLSDFTAGVGGDIFDWDTAFSNAGNTIGASGANIPSTGFLSAAISDTVITGSTTTEDVYFEFTGASLGSNDIVVGSTTSATIESWAAAALSTVDHASGDNLIFAMYDNGATSASVAFLEFTGDATTTGITASELQVIAVADVAQDSLEANNIT